jgi:hypothetical protein
MLPEEDSEDDQHEGPRIPFLRKETLRSMPVDTPAASRYWSSVGPNSQHPFHQSSAP